MLTVPAAAAVIEVRGLGYRYPGADSAALKGIDLDVPRGSTFGLLGPNGAGKSTLLSILTGLLPAPPGSVRIAGFDSARDGAAIRAISALVPQEYAFYPALSGRENLEFFAGVYRLDRAQRRQRLDYAAQVCRLHDVLERRAETYSGGVKRRLNLAIGLLNAPQILYLDEPTVGIDATSRQTIAAAIQALRADGTTVVYTSHYMEEVETLCDTLAVIDRGRVVIQDRMERLLQRSGGKQLHVLLQAAPTPALQQALALWEPVATQPLRWSLTLAEGAAQLPAMLALLAQHGAVVEQLQFGISRLEQVYTTLLEGRALP